MTLFTDDDVERGAAAMARHYAAAPFLTSDLTTTRAVLDAVLPAYRKRLLNELADEVFDEWDGDIYATYAADWLRAKAEETHES